MAVALSEADVAGMLEVIHELADVDGPDAFTEPAVDALLRLLPVDGGPCLNVWAGRNPAIPDEQLTILDFESVGAEWVVPGPEWRQEFREAILLYGREEEPVPPRPEFMLRAVRHSDLMPYREWRSRRMWSLVGRYIAHDSLALWLPGPEAGVMRRFDFPMMKRGTIPDRYVQILQLLAPHFVGFYRRAANRRAAAESAAVSLLTPRELEVMSLVAAGKANKLIARELWLSPHTVRSHLEHVFEKLEVTNRSAAVARAFPAGAQRPQGRKRVGSPHPGRGKTMTVRFDEPRVSLSSSSPPSPPTPSAVSGQRSGGPL
jgi:DNA-binding CsgD family transcriptional regulator